MTYLKYVETTYRLLEETVNNFLKELATKRHKLMHIR